MSEQQQQPTVDDVMNAMLAGILATSLATVRAVQESQSEAFGGNGGARDITLAGGLAATAAQAAQATRDLTSAYIALKGSLDPAAAPAA